MPRKPTKPAPPTRVREPKVAKTYRLPARKIAAAREALGVATATAAITDRFGGNDKRQK
jgi:hypothetical protein